MTTEATPAAPRDTFPDRRGDWMQTATGKRFWPLDPHVDDICIEDIAHALSLTTRFGGHCLRFYSVAEHCVHLARAASPAVALWALLHDASEAYLTDVVRPLKRHLSEYGPAEDRLQRIICEHFGLAPEMPPEVKALDNRILMDERAQVMLPTDEAWNCGGATEPLTIKVECWAPEIAKREFLTAFAKLTGAADPSEGWGWYASADEESYTVGPEASREAVIAAAESECLGEELAEAGDTEGTFFICEARQLPIDLSRGFDAESAAQSMMESADENHGNEDDYLTENAWTKEQHADLEAMLTATVAAWQARHGIVVKPWKFTEIRNRETVTYSIAGEADQADTETVGA